MIPSGLDVLGWGSRESRVGVGVEVSATYEGACLARRGRLVEGYRMEEEACLVVLVALAWFRFGFLESWER